MDKKEEMTEGPQDLLLPPAETVRLRLEIAQAILIAGIVDGVPLIEPWAADTIGAQMVALSTTRRALDEIIGFASIPALTLKRLGAHVEAIRERIEAQKNDRLSHEAKAYATAYRNAAQAPLSNS